MAKYTYKDIIIDPNDPRLEWAIGKECYFNDNPKMILEQANNNSPDYLFRLKEVNKNDAYPFTDEEHEYDWALIIIKKEEPKKYVPFENMDEFLTAYMRQDVTRLSPRGTTLFARGFWLKFDSEYIQIITFSEKTILTSYCWENFESMLEKFTFLDGSPCGKEVSNE